ncbi:hypothetical protein KR222_007537, partial [Zaprionus bogoriensis]
NADVAASTATATAAAAAAVPNVSSNSSVRLLIKSSNQQYDDMNIESDLCWTVERLKKQLSLVYPGKPDISDQKLIYSGKLLNDAQKLSEVIRSYKDVYQQHHIFHLVCANKNLPKAPLKTTLPPKDNSATAAPRVDSNTNDNELRQRHVATAAASQIPYQQQQQQQQLPLSHTTYSWMQFLQTQAQQPPVASTTHMAFHQHQQQQAMLYNAWVQQWYAAYMQQMMQRMSVPQPVVPAVPVAGEAVGVAGQVNDAAAVAQQPAARQVAAGGPNFPNIQEEPEMQDWLDSFFSFTRLAIFATVLYFNSSPMRCLLVMLIATVIYLYHIGVLRRRRERNNNNINRNNNAGNDVGAFAAVQQIQRMMDAAVELDNNPQAAVVAPAAVVAGAEPAPAAAAAAAGQEDAAAPASAAGAEQADAAVAAVAEAVAVEPANANNSVISIVRTFVITFFTSLLPEAPAL